MPNLPVPTSAQPMRRGAYSIASTNPYVIACRLACIRATPEDERLLGIMYLLGRYDKEIADLLGEQRVVMAQLKAWVKKAETALDSEDMEACAVIYERHRSGMETYRDIMCKLYLLYDYLHPTDAYLAGPRKVALLPPPSL